MSVSSGDYHSVLERIPPRAEPAFEEPGMLERVWGRRWGVRNDVGRLRFVLMHRPGDELKIMCDPDRLDADLGALIDDEEQWYFRSKTPPDIEKMQRQHDALADALRGEGVEVQYIEDASPYDPKAMFTRDVAIAVPGGAIVCRMGPVGRGGGRRGEEAFATRKIAGLGMPILHTVHGSGLFEGGSFALIDERTAAVGMSHRQNEEGVRQIECVLSAMGIKLVKVPLTGHSLHLDGCFVMVDEGVALVNVARLPYWFTDTMRSLDVRPVHVHPDDDWYAINCLAVRPGRVIMCVGAERTAERLAGLGIEPTFVDMSEIHKNGGSVHCSTLPLVRDPA